MKYLQRLGAVIFVFFAVLITLISLPFTGVYFMVTGKDLTRFLGF